MPQTIERHALVAGGAGFIGAHLVRDLLSRGFKVTVWDNMRTGREKNLAELGNTIDFQKRDIRNATVEDAAGLKNGRITHIFNLACPASPPHYQKDPIYTWETSVLGTRNLLHIAEAQEALFLHASTSEVYGDPQVHPQSEDYWGNVNPVGLRSCYDEGKRAAETLCADFRRFKNVDARLFRIFNTYGEFMHPDDGRVISNFCVAALKKEPIPIYGDGSQTRSFCYVADLVAGILALSDLPRERYSGPINLGNPHEFSIRELVQVLERVTGQKLITKNLPLPADDPKVRKPVIDRARDALNWEPKIELEAGLKKTLAYFAREIEGVK